MESSAIARLPLPFPFRGRSASTRPHWTAVHLARSPEGPARFRAHRISIALQRQARSKGYWPWVQNATCAYRRCWDKSCRLRGFSPVKRQLPSSSRVVESNKPWNSKGPISSWQICKGNPVLEVATGEISHDSPPAIISRFIPKSGTASIGGSPSPTSSHISSSRNLSFCRSTCSTEGPPPRKTAVWRTEVLYHPT